jgi:hypothetical protein
MASNNLALLVNAALNGTPTYTTNIYSPGTITGNAGLAAATPFAVMRHIHVFNKNATAITFRLQVGATGAAAAGTEIFYDQSVAGNTGFDWYGAIRFIGGTTFLTGAASTTLVNITAWGELGMY